MVCNIAQKFIASDGEIIIALLISGTFGLFDIFIVTLA